MSVPSTLFNINICVQIECRCLIFPVQNAQIMLGSTCTNQCCRSRGSGTFRAPGSGSLKSKTSTKTIRKPYTNFLREDMAISLLYISYDFKVRSGFDTKLSGSATLVQIMIWPLDGDCRIPLNFVHFTSGERNKTESQWSVKSMTSRLWWRGRLVAGGGG